MKTNKLKIIAQGILATSIVAVVGMGVVSNKEAPITEVPTTEAPIEEPIIEEVSLNIDEYKVFIEILNYEIQKSGGSIVIENILNSDDIILKTISKIEKREIIENNIKLGDGVIDRNIYNIIRSGIFSKVKIYGIYQ